MRTHLNMFSPNKANMLCSAKKKKKMFRWERSSGRTKFHFLWLIIRDFQIDFLLNFLLKTRVQNIEGIILILKIRKLHPSGPLLLLGSDLQPYNSHLVWVKESRQLRKSRWMKTVFRTFCLNLKDLNCKSIFVALLSSLIILLFSTSITNSKVFVLRLEV